MPSFNSQTTIQDIAAAYPGALEGRTYLVTGATSGLGRAFSKSIAQLGAGTVVITGRSEQKLAKTLQDVKSTASSKTTVKPLLLDLESEESVRRAAEQITSGALGIPKIDVLVNNAGIFAVPYKKVGGYESHFYCNHLSHFLFTNLILSHIASPGRIINVSSIGHSNTKVRFDDINFKDGEEYNKIDGYCQSKAANILFSIGLTKRFGETKGIQSYSFNPGLVITPIMDHLDMVAEGIKNEKTGTYWDKVPITYEQGTATYLYTALAPELNGKGGAYLDECQIANTGYPMTEEDVDRLWNLSNSAFGTSF
ncbi:putative short-chain dehydrogenase [Cyathus striatus]|nr:putative short-chain dehydrogenase [Cyathus striatus]